MNFLFWLFLAGIIIAVLQDFKRREIDNWLNLFLLFSSFFYLLLISLILKESSIIFIFAFSLLFMYAISHILYYGRFFAGGDAKLLFALTGFFVLSNLYETLSNIGLFLILLVFSGSIYGLFYSFVIYSKNYEEVNKKFKKGFDELWMRFSIILGVIFFVASYINIIFLVPAIFLIVFPTLYSFVKALEKVSFIKLISGEKLREGDWLGKDIKVGKKVFKYSFDGLTKEDLRILKNQKKVWVKEGMPFALAFLMAFLSYELFRTYFLNLFHLLF